MVGPLKEVEVEAEAEGEAQLTKRSRSHIVKPAVSMGDSLAPLLVEQGTAGVAQPSKGKDPLPQMEEGHWSWVHLL